MNSSTRPVIPQWCRYRTAQKSHRSYLSIKYKYEHSIVEPEWTVVIVSNGYVLSYAVVVLNLAFMITRSFDIFHYDKYSNNYRLMNYVS